MVDVLHTPIFGRISLASVQNKVTEHKVCTLRKQGHKLLSLIPRWLKDVHSAVHALNLKTPCPMSDEPPVF